MREDEEEEEEDDGGLSGKRLGSGTMVRVALCA